MRARIRSRGRAKYKHVSAFVGVCLFAPFVAAADCPPLPMCALPGAQHSAHNARLRPCARRRTQLADIANTALASAPSVADTIKVSDVLLLKQPRLGQQQLQSRCRNTKPDVDSACNRPLCPPQCRQPRLVPDVPATAELERRQHCGRERELWHATSPVCPSFSHFAAQRRRQRSVHLVPQHKPQFLATLQTP